MSKNNNLTINIEITECSHCPNFSFIHNGCQGDHQYCDHPDAPVSIKIGNGYIPINCPRNKFFHAIKTEPIVVIVNGFPTAGKDTFCEFADLIYDTVNYSTVDTVKDIAITMGWDGTKDPSSRNMLSALKDFYVEWFDGTFFEMVALIDHTRLVGDDQFIFLHTREPEEIERVVEWCTERNQKCYSVFIDRQVETEHGNHADAGVTGYEYDLYVINDGTLEEFKEKSLDIFALMVDNKI